MGMFGSRGSFLMYMPVCDKASTDVIAATSAKGDKLPSKEHVIRRSKLQHKLNKIKKKNDLN